jgi:hypothetical protein
MHLFPQASCYNLILGGGKWCHKGPPLKRPDLKHITILPTTLTYYFVDLESANLFTDHLKDLFVHLWLSLLGKRIMTFL